ncbi:hypothetical protein Asi03nite_62380 [Actinoplanes siamensis]|uniref:Uncharacterized protein n=2 Tax=Actinoplanes siamensis TaxID=1223317 RepID=A0A919NDN7_9ACTN|nr:hypothetical protein Asi03nite_62380 [Actinoplanes siamensis]
MLPLGTGGQGYTPAAQTRLNALDLAVRAHEAYTSIDLVSFGSDGPSATSRGEEILATARQFEAYLRDEGDARSETSGARLGGAA